MKSKALLAILGGLLMLSPISRASEGGASVYVQGAYNDFAVGMTPPPGFYLRNDVLLNDASFGAIPLGGRIEANVHQQVWVEMVKLAWVSDFKILGGTYGAAVIVPVLINAHASGGITVAGRGISGSGNTSGFGDIVVAPLSLGWKAGDHNFNFASNVVIPSGDYSADRLLNNGRNYWAFDETVSYTWLNPKIGTEVSFTAGLLFNTENEDTNYRTGNEFHLDWLIGQHFSEQFAIGFIGYWYEQIGHDEGTLPPGFSPGNFTAHSVGIGPALIYTPKIGGKDVSFIAKWLHDLDAGNRAEGDLVMLSVAFKF